MSKSEAAEIARLFQNLVDAGKIYTRDPREGAERALLSVSSFVSRLAPLDAALMRRPFDDLLGAMIDARRGLKNPLTQPNQYAGGTKKRLIEARNLAIGAAAVTLFIDAGIVQEAALIKVASILQTKKAIQIKNFRDQILRERANEEAMSVYSHYLTVARTFSWPDQNPTRMQRAEKLCDILKQISANGF